MAWKTKMHTPKSAKGTFDGVTKTELRRMQKRLRRKQTRTPTEQLKLKRVNFALRAKNDFGRAK